MMEQWHPLGIVGSDYRFQFSGRRLGLEQRPGRRLRRFDRLETFEQTPLSAIADDKIAERVCSEWR